MTTRADCLGDIRREMSKTRGLFEARPVPRPPDAGQAFEMVKRQMAERWPQALERFREEFERIAGVFHCVARMDEVPGVIKRLAEERQVKRVLSWTLGRSASTSASLGAEAFRSRWHLTTIPMSPPGGSTGMPRRARRWRHRRGLGSGGDGHPRPRVGSGGPRSTCPARHHVAVFDRGCLLESLDQVGTMLEALHADPAGACRERHQLHHGAIAHRRHRAHAHPWCTAREEVHAIFVEGDERAPVHSGRGQCADPQADRARERGDGLHRRGRALQEALAEERDRIRASGGAMVDQRDWKARAERLDGYSIEVKQALARIAELGGVTKDVEMGLVDFPGLVPQVAGTQPVNLCWKHGEDAVRFWHGFDEGYAHRKPLP
jgi:hypothetical protein